MANTYSLDLDSGSSQYASRADTSSLSLTSDYTIEAWINVDDLPGTNAAYRIVSKGDYNVDSAYTFSFNNSADVYYLYAYAVQTADTTTQDVVRQAWEPTPGTWYHVAVTCDISEASATTFEFFVNGSSIGNGTALVSDNCSSINDSSEPFYVGAWESSGSVAEHFNGKIDDVRVWSDIRSDAELLANYQRELGGSEAGLVGYWKLNNGYTDSQVSGNNDLTASGSPVFSTSVPFVGDTGFLALL